MQYYNVLIFFLLVYFCILIVYIGYTRRGYKGKEKSRGLGQVHGFSYFYVSY